MENDETTGKLNEYDPRSLLKPVKVLSKLALKQQVISSYLVMLVNPILYYFVR